MRWFEEHMKRDRDNMLLSYFDDLRSKTGFLEKRDISIQNISVETGLSQRALVGVKNLKMERVYLSVMCILCDCLV